LPAGGAAHAVRTGPAVAPRLLALAHLRLMINFRYHLAALTAVFLALGVGLLLGTTFLDDALENQLRSDLEELEHDLDRAGERNPELRQQLDAFEEEAGGLDEQLGARLFDGQLLGQPVLVVAPRGIDEGLVERVTTALDQADADVMGTWWLTDRLVLGGGEGGGPRGEG